MRVFVTGGAGFIGRHLIRKLKKRQVEIGLLVHRSGDEIEGVRRYAGDILDRDSLFHAFSNFQPEIIFHLAAQPIVRNSHINRQLDYETVLTNMSGTLNMFDVAMRTPSLKKFVHISTDKVFGDTDYIQQSSCLIGTKHPYNASKLAGDVLAQMFASYYSVPTVIVRHGNVYGEGDLHWDRLIPRTIRQIYQDYPPIIRGDGSSSRDYIHVDDVTDAYLKLMELHFRDNPHIINFGSESPYTTQYIVDDLLKLMGRVDMSIQYESVWTGEIPHQHIDNEGARRIGWSPKIGIQEGLERTAIWYTKYLDGNYD